jgi:hypothetical protein
VGSFWFAALVVQNLGYYLIAALLIPVGIGHVRLRRWALTLTQLTIWFWLGAGMLLCANLIALAPSLSKLDLSREVLFLRSGVTGAAAVIFLILLPLLGLRFYRSEKVRSIFEAHDPNRYWTERTPLPVLALLLLFGIMILVLHIGIFFQSMFPVFGQILLGRSMVYVYSACILITGILIYGTARLKTWAWWSSLVFLSLLAVSTILSFSRYSFSDLIQMMDLPAYEVDFLNRIVLLQDYPLVGLLTGPLLAGIGLAIYSRRYFRIDRRAGERDKKLSL